MNRKTLQLRKGDSMEGGPSPREKIKKLKERT